MNNLSGRAGHRHHRRPAADRADDRTRHADRFEVEDLGEPGRADSFRLVTGDGYGAGGVLLNGNIDVTGGIL